MEGLAEELLSLVAVEVEYLVLTLSSSHNSNPEASVKVSLYSQDNNSLYVTRYACGLIKAPGFVIRKSPR